MRTAIETNSRTEGDAVKRALTDARLRALATVGGYLLEIDSIADRRQVLLFLLHSIGEGDSSSRHTNGDTPEILRLHDGTPDTGE
jgi:hypothetical protein